MSLIFRAGIRWMLLFLYVLLAVGASVRDPMVLLRDPLRDSDRRLLFHPCLLKFHDLVVVPKYITLFTRTSNNPSVISTHPLEQKYCTRKNNQVR